MKAGSTRLLVDAGLSYRELCHRLELIGETPAQLDAILVTHEHSDHVCGLPTLVRRTRRPVYLTHQTAPAIDWRGCEEPPVECFQAGSRFAIGDFQVSSFTVPHDSVDPVGYILRAEGVQLALVTDLGYVPDSIKIHLRGTHFMVLESNHDLDMLKVGPYPWSVKQRVLSRKGHLSNDVASDYIRNDLPTELDTLVLGHLSENNNHPAIAEMTARYALSDRGCSTSLVVAEPRKQLQLFHL